MIENNLKYLRAYFRGIPRIDFISSKSEKSSPNGNSSAPFPEILQKAQSSGSANQGARGWQIFWDGRRLKLNYPGESGESGFSGVAEFWEEGASRQLHFSFDLPEEQKIAQDPPGTLRLEFTVRFSGVATGSGEDTPALPAAAVEYPKALAEELLASLPHASSSSAPLAMELEGPRLLDNPRFENTLTVLQGIIDHLRSSVEANRPFVSPGPLIPNQPDWPEIPVVDFWKNRDQVEHIFLKIHAIAARKRLAER